MPRRDVRLTGHAEVPGTISQPAVLWRHHLGRGRVGSIICRDLDGDGELEILREAAGRLVATTLAGESKWEAEAGGPVVTIAELDEDGRLHVAGPRPGAVPLPLPGGIFWRALFGESDWDQLEAALCALKGRIPPAASHLMRTLFPRREVILWAPDHF